MRASDLPVFFSMALKPKDVRVPLPVQLILDCHWLVCVRGEGLTDRSIDALYVNDILFLRPNSHTIRPK